MTTNQPNNPTHGVTLEMMLTHLVNIYGWDELSDMTKIKAFAINPSIKSGLNFIRKTPWGKKKIEDLYRDCLKKK